MKKFLKYSLYGLIYVIVIFFLAVMFIVTAKADLVKPNNEIKPYQVVKIQLTGLMNNDIPNKNSGIEQTWEFAHPSNKKYTGPLSKFVNLLKSESYNMLLNHLQQEVYKKYQLILLMNLSIISLLLMIIEPTILNINTQLIRIHLFNILWKTGKLK